jgi:hypothetical protein
MHDSTTDINLDLAHDDGRGDPARAGDQPAEQAEESEKRTALYETPGRGYGCVYGPAASKPSAVRTPGFRFDEPDSLCDTPGHELTE